VTDTGPDDSPEVLIAGAGAVGLTLAVSLGQRGIRCLLAERMPEQGILPRMDLTNARSMEIFGRLGLAGKIRDAGWPLDARFNVFVGRSLAEDPYAMLSYPSILEARERSAVGTDGSQPREPYERISQYNLEALLADEARGLPTVDVCFDSEIVGLRQDSESVQATIRNGDGTERTVSAKYLVGCDGGGSFVRKALGISNTGQPRAARYMLIFFRCPDLLKQTGLDAFRHYYIAGERGGLLIPQDDLQRWAFHFPLAADVDASLIDPAAEVSDRLGLDLDIDVLYASAWHAHLLVAGRYGEGRVFLAGDAAHQYIPTGGFGLNTGIGDADNLAWKLAAALRGWAGPVLLESYHDERQPVGARNRRASEYAATGLATWIGYWDPVVDEDTPEGRAQRRRFVSAVNTYQRRSHEQQGTESGYRYSLSPVIFHESGSLPDPDSPVFQPSAAPGTRLPHLWLERGVSVHDRLGSGFTLLALDADPGQVAAFEIAAGRRGIPLDVLSIDNRSGLKSVYGASMLLIRPDLHIAWRGESADSADAILAFTSGQLLPYPSSPSGERS
jgi:2-polyprenyl-6-methoxyphenol hydroxylase-like FAD-dependent oxidoreductase